MAPFREDPTGKPPQRLKPQSFDGAYGTTEVVP
jgi:hypothetical protein